MFIVKSIQKIVAEIAHTIARYPAPVLISLLAAVLIIFRLHFIEDYPVLQQKLIIVRMIFACVCAIPFYIAVDFFAQTKHVENSKKFGLYLLGFCILGLHYYSIKPTMFDSDAIFITRYLIFIVAFHLLVSIIVFYDSEDMDSFWQYNYLLFLQFVKSVGFSLSLFVGIASAIWASDNLFGLHINQDYYLDVAAIIFFPFNTIFFLKLIPTNFNIFKKSLEYKKSIRVFAKNILLPIVAIYIAILYIYMLKILLEHRIPNGWITIPILLFAILGILAYLLLYPIRDDKKSRVTYIYSRYFFYILLPLLSLYFLAIFKRIVPYGLTENRYLVLILGLWMVIISVYFILSKKKNITTIPISLFLVISLAAIGPWGMFQLSLQNQHYRLEKILQKNNLLENNKLVHASSKKVNTQDAKSIRSIVLYLNNRGEINRIHRWLGEADQKILEQAIKNNEFSSLNSIFINEEIDLREHHTVNIHFNNETNFLESSSYSIKGFDGILHVNFYNDNDIDLSDSSIHIFTKNNTTLCIKQEKDSLFTYEFDTKLKNLVAYTHQHDSLNNNESQSTIELFQDKDSYHIIPSDSMIISKNKYQLIINNLHIRLIDSTYILLGLDGYLLNKK